MPNVTYGDDSTGLMLCTNYAREEDGTLRPIAYAYGKPWVAQALYMDDLKFDTPDEAIKWWNENYGQN